MWFHQGMCNAIRQNVHLQKNNDIITTTKIPDINRLLKF